MAKPVPKKSKSQVAKFRETARALEADESEEKFDVALKKMAKSPPPKPQPKKPAQ
jgi:hypothetical protein